MNIRQVALQIIERLKAEGLTIQRYNAYSTSSVYLKLDYGVCNSIRISDHAGKKHLAYRYNVHKRWHSRPVYEQDGQFLRYYYGFQDIDTLIEDILSDRRYKLQLYGEERYQQFMAGNKAKGATQKGFWQSAVEV